MNSQTWLRAVPPTISAGLCGPGGASVTTNGATVVYHAWQGGSPSSKVRDDYTASLTWTASGPSVS